MTEIDRKKMLTEQDVMLLLQERSSPAARAAVASKVAASFAQETLSESELQLAQDIIRAMVKDVAVEVRQALSENLKSSPEMPREVAIKLAQDVESVALPVLEFSNVLTEEDLVELIKLTTGQSSSETKHKAIARREEVPETVADALVEHAGEAAVATLVSNKGADLTEKSLQKVVQKFPESTPVKTGLVHRDKLPVTIAEQLVTMVADNLREHLIANHELKPETATDMVLLTRERAIVQLVSKGADSPDVERLVAQMHSHGRLTPSIILRALCTGDVTFFEASMAVMTGVPLVNARLLIHDAGRLGLKSIHEKSGLPVRYLPAVRAAIDVLKETEMSADSDYDRERFRNTVIERILTQYVDLGEEDLNYLLSKIIDAPRAA